MARKIRIRTRRNRLPKEFHTKLIVDETDTDNGSFYHCANCGFTCNDKQDSLGGANSGLGISHTDIRTISGGSSVGDELSSSMILRTLDNSFASGRLGSDGNPKAAVHNHVAVVSGGCPFCGTLNWRGDFP